MHCISPYSSVFYSRIKTFISRIQLCFVHRSQKRCLFCDVFLLCKDISNMSQKDVFSVMSPRRLKNISPNLLWFFKNTPRKWFRVISVGLLKYLIKYITHMRSRKIVQLRPPPPPRSPTPHPLQMITNQFKENMIQGWLLYVVRSFLHVNFRFPV